MMFQPLNILIYQNFLHFVICFVVHSKFVYKFEYQNDNNLLINICYEYE